MNITISVKSTTYRLKTKKKHSANLNRLVIKLYIFLLIFIKIEREKKKKKKKRETQLKCFGTIIYFLNYRRFMLLFIDCFEIAQLSLFLAHDVQMASLFLSIYFFKFEMFCELCVCKNKNGSREVWRRVSKNLIALKWLN